MAYEPLERFAAPARGRAEIWRTVAGVFAAFVAGLALYQLALALLATLIGPQAMRALWDEATFSGSTPRGAYLTLFSFAFFAVGTVMAARGLHGRGLLSLIGPPGAAARDFVAVAVAVGALFLFLLILLPQDYQLVRNAAMPVGLWLALLPLSLAAVLVQAGAEELFFRGYLQQQLAARAQLGPVWMLVPAALFGLAHWAPETAGPNAGAYVAWAFAFGLAAADLTARTGTLGAALGLHFANNVFAVLVTALLGPGSGLALWHVPLDIGSAELAALIPVEFATLGVAWLAARLALRV